MKSIVIDSKHLDLLKWFAILGMILDHAFKILSSTSIELNNIIYVLGRTSYPLFAFIVMYNYINNTRDKVKYIKRLAIFAAVSQVPFSYAFTPMVMNIFFSLFFATTAIYLIKKMRDDKDKLTVFISGIMVILLLFLSNYSDYGILGFLFTISLYFFIKNPTIKNGAISFVLFFLTNELIYIEQYFNNLIEIDYILSSSIRNILATVLILLIYKAIKLYGEIKINTSVNKYFYYMFYPAHLSILYMFKMFY